MKIIKSEGVTPTERLLADLCDRSFLKLWSYPNPFKEDKDELCDLLAVFENHVFIFFDREKNCIIYPVRPRQCVTYPFWYENVITLNYWEKLKLKCPGIGTGKRYSGDEIREKLWGKQKLYS